LNTSLKHYVEARKGLDDLATGESGRKPIHPQYVAKILNEVTAEDASVYLRRRYADYLGRAYLHMNGKRRLLGSFTHGSMANALPQAIGAQVSHPGRQVISLSGDGGLAMLMGDLLSLRQLNLPVKLIVFNNSSLAFVELEMNGRGYPRFGTNLHTLISQRCPRKAGILGLEPGTAIKSSR